MEIPRVTLDTHALIWFVHRELKRKLSERALNAIRMAQAHGIVYIPTIALMETLDLIERGRISLPFAELMDSIERNDSYRIVPFDAELVWTAIPLKGMEIHDRLILATAIATDSVLVSKDREIGSRGFDVIW